MKNNLEDWLDDYLPPQASDHKYKRGQVAVLGGVVMTGAACLAAHSAARAGAGLVTIIAPYLTWQQKLKIPDPLPIYKAYQPHIIARNDMSLLDYVTQRQGKGCVVSVIGPGLGDDEYGTVRQIALSVLGQKCLVVLDADGLNAFGGYAKDLAGQENLVLTPHEGEFKRLFSEYAGLLKEDRVKAAQMATEKTGAVIVLKGSKTIIAAKGREPIVNENAPPSLATAGSGDVLAGMIAGLSAQGMEPFKAACAAVWIHGEAANRFGLGLVASDLPDLIPEVLQEVLGIYKKLG